MKIFFQADLIFGSKAEYVIMLLNLEKNAMGNTITYFLIVVIFD
jgi:hypothetical protein